MNTTAPKSTNCGSPFALRLRVERNTSHARGFTDDTVRRKPQRASPATRQALLPSIGLLAVLVMMTGCGKSNPPQQAQSGDKAAAHDTRKH